MSFLLLPHTQELLHTEPSEQGCCSPSSARPGNGREISRTGCQEQRASFSFAVTAVYSSSWVQARVGMLSLHPSHLTCGRVSAHPLDAREEAEAPGGCSLIHNESATPQLPNAAASSSSHTPVICPKTLIFFFF